MLAVLFGVFALSFIDRTALAILAEPIKLDLRLSDTQMSVLLGPAFTLIYAIFGVILGWASDRYPRRWVIYFGVTLWSCAAAATGFVRSFSGLLLSRAGVAVGEGALSPAAMSLIVDTFPRQRLALAMSIYQSAAYVGMGAAFASVGLIAANVAAIQRVIPMLAMLRPWEVAFVTVGAPGAVLALLVFTFGEPPRRVSPASSEIRSTSRGEIVPFLKAEWRLLALLAGGVSSMAIAAAALQAWVPAYLQRHFGWGAAQFGPYLSAAGLIGAVTLMFKGGIMDWLFGRGIKDAHIRLYTWLLIASTPGIYLLFMIESPKLFILIYAVVQVIALPFAVFVMPALQLVAPPACRGQIIGGALAVYSAASALGPVIVGVLTDRVFHDPQSLGLALGLVLGITFPIAIAMLRLSLRGLRNAIEAAEIAS